MGSQQSLAMVTHVSVCLGHPSAPRNPPAHLEASLAGTEVRRQEMTTSADPVGAMTKSILYRVNIEKSTKNDEFVEELCIQPRIGV